jgi:hypothetical protein
LYVDRLPDQRNARSPAPDLGTSGGGSTVPGAQMGFAESGENSCRLLRLRKTANLKRLIERQFSGRGWTRASEASQGWQAIDDSLQLSGWSNKRRVVVLRRLINPNPLPSAARRRPRPQRSIAAAVPSRV